MLQDSLINAALTGIGYNMLTLGCPDNRAMQVGKEFGNRGQCNPTYFTVGNLVKYLIELRDEQGLSTERILQDYVFVTAGACGPCRFGLYVTEYRKALRDAGFEGFRVLLFQGKGGINQHSLSDGVEFSPAFFKAMFRGIVAGDVLNLMGYRLRPYEKAVGSVDVVLEQCKQRLCERLKQGKGLTGVLKQCRKLLDKVELDRLQVKPRVSVIGEFWAMTTEGDGNYHLQRFLEQEGAEVDSQPITNWTLYMIWSAMFDSRKQFQLKNSMAEKILLAKKMALLKLVEQLMSRWFYRYARAAGLQHYHLAGMQQLADDSHDFYTTELRGGEGHMEVGKLIQSVKYNKSHLVISVKPFGCMPSSGVSDGVQSLVMSKFPEANFLPIETSGDGAVNIYSRIQMALFKAKTRAQKEIEQLCEKDGKKNSNFNERVSLRKKLDRSTLYPRHAGYAGTLANIIRIYGKQYYPIRPQTKFGTDYS
ncbi:MAG: 2-hydroxyglutaryl-CoA dehydratase [Gammaproteobacteria bacterium]|nr:2-hydroxyglutaryl-CoA dehydratase [Gammaproteobacteria bacterium]